MKRTFWDLIYMLTFNVYVELKEEDLRSFQYFIKRKLKKNEFYLK